MLLLLDILRIAVDATTVKQCPYISFDPPGKLGKGICTANAILPKNSVIVEPRANYDSACAG